MPGHDHGASIKNSHVYEALRRRGYSKTKAAKISNAMVGRGHKRTRGGHQRSGRR